MKKIISSSAAALIMLVAITSCKKDTKSLDTNVSAAGTLMAPANQTTLKLASGGPGVVFKWNAATATAGGVILYEVLFDRAGGDFSKPVYKILSDGSGIQVQATIPQDTLNKIASLVDIKPLSSGNLKWTVNASKAANLQPGSTSNVIQITRPANTPTELYLIGTASEANSIDATKGIAFKSTSAGVFELYTSLKAGTYQLTDKNNGSGTPYYIDANGVIQQGTGTTTVSGATSPYRIQLNFNVATSNIVAIQSVGLFMSAYNAEIGQLSYMGNSTWENPKIPVTFYQFSWGRDERYKFALHTSAGVEYMGSSNKDNGAPAGQAASYFYLTPVTNSQWDNTYKFDPSIDTHNAKVDLYYKASAAYTHTATAVN